MEWMLLPLRRYAEFTGRSRRMEFWMFAVFQFLLFVALYVLFFAIAGGSIAMLANARGSGVAGGLAALGGGIMVISLLFVVLWLGLIIPNLAVAVRRMHDSGRSGWWVLAPYLGIVLQFTGVFSRNGLFALVGGLASFGLGITVLVFYFLDGTPGPNEYGPDPKSRIDPRVFA